MGASVFVVKVIGLSVPNRPFRKRHRFIFVFHLQLQTRKTQFSTVSDRFPKKTALRRFLRESRKSDNRKSVEIRLS